VAVSSLAGLIESKMTRLDSGQFQCLDCPYTHKARQRLQFHIESKHVDGPGHVCELCHKVCPTKNALNLHRSRHHKTYL